MWSEVSKLSLNFVPSPHYSLFVTSIFILVHMYTTESLIRGQSYSYLSAKELSYESKREIERVHSYV